MLADQLQFALNAAMCSLGLLISLAIGFRQADRKSSRALAPAFLWFSTNLGASYAPPQWPLAFVRLINDGALMPGWYFGLWFAVHYPDGTPAGWRRGMRRVLPLFLVGLVAVVGSLAMYVGLSYAILRHRVLDMGLAVNRSLVFAVVGLVLLGSFQLLQVVTARLLHFDDPARAGLLSGVLAVLVVLAYPKVKPRAEWLIDRLFFRDWVAREADLARFAADARGFTEASSLAAALVGAIDRFTARASATLYVRASDGRFERQQTSTAGAPKVAAPPMVDADEPLAVALRAGRSASRRDEVHSALPGELAMVLSRQRELDAFVLIGRRQDGSILRSDEVAALHAALQSVGVEWQALRWEALQRELARK